MLQKEVERSGKSPMAFTGKHLTMVVDSQYVEALEREVRERETYDVLQQLRAEAEMEVGRHP